MISFNNFQKIYRDKKNLIDKALNRVCGSGRFILGREVSKFEADFSSYIGTSYTIGVGNGLEALQISLMALDIGPGDEVITTSLSAVATALSIKAVGAKPIFADIDEYYHIDPDSIEKNITPKTKAIIPVHLYGQAANMKKIMEIAKKYKLHVIGIKRKVPFVKDDGDTDFKDDLIIAPSPTESLQDGDILVAIGKYVDIERVKNI